MSNEIKESVAKDTADVKSDKLPANSLTDIGQQAMQGPLEADSDTINTVVPPSEHNPKRAVGEKGDAERAETGAEKTEKEIFTGFSSEGKPKPPPGWRPGGFERGG